jgi:hypothetical protein
VKIGLGIAQFGLDYVNSKSFLDVVVQALACDDIAERLQGSPSAAGFKRLT